MMTYWQHEKPLTCPKGHRMYWLGSVFWMCPKEHCGTVYVQTKPRKRTRRPSREGYTDSGNMDYPPG